MTNEEILKAIQEITDLCYKLAMASPTLNPEADRIIPNARIALEELQSQFC